ncbi:MAG TPA: helix-turn-helix transcriptional regulator [Longimicrobiales bacterium]|nr:helix-turn-helix transcriptional regulator [Longimicrobiales bacterium]
MSLTLSDTDLDRIRAVQEALLSVHARPSVAAWGESVLIEARRLFRSDSALLVLPHDEGLELASSPEMSLFLDPVKRMIEGVEAGANRYRGPQVQGSQALRREMGLELWTNRMLVELDGRPMEDTGWFYHEFIEPAGARKGGGMTVPLPLGEAMFLLTPGHPADNPFGDEWLRMLGLLLPAFKAAVRHLQHRRLSRRYLLRVVDELRRMTWLWSGEAKELHRNPSLRRLLREPDARRIEDAARILVRRTVEIRRRSRKSHPPDPGSPGERVVEVASGRYRMRALYLDLYPAAGSELVLVEIEPLAPKLPGRKTLQARFGLTPRQAEVAILLARGASNRAVADTLGISTHTVRSHAEIVFHKLDVHTRKALALHLLGLPEHSTE